MIRKNMFSRSSSISMKFWYRAAVALAVLVVFVAQTPIPVEAQLSESERKELEKQLIQIEQEILEQNKLLGQKRQETQSLERDVGILNAQIKKAQLNIRQKGLTINELSGQISQRQQTIEQLTAKIEREKQSLAELIRQTDQADDRTMVEMVLSNQNLSSFFEDFDRYQEVKLQLQASINEIRTVKGVTEEEQRNLDSQRRAEQDAKAAVEQQKRQVEIKEAEKKQLASISRSQEKEYEAVIAEKKRIADQIRQALFSLRGAGPIPFGDALRYANQASAATGVRPAMILAILQQESDLGRNVGTCNRPGDALTWKDIMPGPGQSWRDDQSAYLRIVGALGLSPEGQPLSCPIGAGWGGAMGPSQFIPTTWESYAGQIAGALGAGVSNPWNPQHAVMATALYLRDLGAGAKTYTAEREAACKYYSGRGCGLSSMDNTFYGNGVVNKAETIQVCQIDPIESNSLRPSWCPSI